MAKRKRYNLTKLRETLAAAGEYGLTLGVVRGRLVATFYLHGAVDTVLATRFIQHVHVLVNAKLGRLVIDIHSEGGSVDDGLAIYDVIRNLTERGITVDGHVSGSALSIACVILQACSRRFATKNATIMHHRGTLEGGGTMSPAEMVNTVIYEEGVMDTTDRLVYERVKGVYKIDGKKATFDEFQKAGDRAIYMCAADAVEQGFIDEVV